MLFIKHLDLMDSKSPLIASRLSLMRYTTAFSLVACRYPAVQDHYTYKYYQKLIISYQTRAVDVIIPLENREIQISNHTLTHQDLNTKRHWSLGPFDALSYFQLDLSTRREKK